MSDIRMRFVPINVRDGINFVRAHHRHGKAVAGAKLAIGLEYGGELIGVGLLGRPVSRKLAEDRTCGEAIRVCVREDAPKGACSKIQARLQRIWQLMGGVRFVTYNRADESGRSLSGVTGLDPVATVRAESWDRPSRPRQDRAAPIAKTRWEAALNEVPA